MTDHAARSSQLDYATEAYKPLTDRELSELARTGDQDAAWTLTSRVEAIIQKCVRKQIRNKPENGVIDVDDLLQAVRQVVARAMGNWVAGDGATFHLRTYAARVAKNEVSHQLAAANLISVDSNTRRIALKQNEQAERFAEEHGREPDCHELATRTGTSPWEVQKRLGLLKGGVPLDELGGSDREGDDEPCFTGRTEPCTDPEASPSAIHSCEDYSATLRKLISELPAPQRAVMTLLFPVEGEPELTVEQVWQTLGLTQCEGDKRRKKAILTIRARLRSEDGGGLGRLRVGKQGQRQRARHGAVVAGRPHQGQPRHLD
jgi:DNA-directed RNA polymerase specialized sigma subunit